MSVEVAGRPRRRPAGELRVALGERRLADLRRLAAELEVSEQEIVRLAIDIHMGRVSVPSERRQNAVETPSERRQNAVSNAPLACADAREESTPCLGTGLGEKKKKRASRQQRGMEVHPPEVRRIFEAWVETIVAAGETAPAAIDKESAITINERLKEGIPVETLVDAVHGWQFDPWPDRKSPTAHLIRAMLKNRATVDKFRKFKLDAHARAREPDEADLGYERADQFCSDRGINPRDLLPFD